MFRTGGLSGLRSPRSWWVPAAVGLVLAGMLPFVLRGNTNWRTGLDAAGLRTLVVEAHDEWNGDPPTVPPAPMPSPHAPLAVRNRNPLNVKLGAATRSWIEMGLATISRWLPRDGGRFLKFSSPAAGFRAAVQLFSSPAYASLDLDSALRRWSNNGYGAEIVSSLDPATPVSTLQPDDLKLVLGAMAVAEGYKSATLTEDIARAVAESAKAP